MKSPRAGTVRSTKVHNLVDPDLQKLFMVHVSAYERAKDKVDKAGNALRTLVGTIKGDGFSVMQIKDAIRMQTPEGEAEFKAEIANRMLAAAYVGSDIGEQLSLFLDTPRVPAVDRAYKEGQTRAMENKTLECKYDPSTDQYRAFVDGYHEEQARQINGGITKLEAKADAAAEKPAGRRGRPRGKGAAAPAAPERRLITKAEKEAKAAEKAKPSSPPRKPKAQPATRASMAAQKAAVRQEADSFFTKSPKEKEALN